MSKTCLKWDPNGDISDYTENAPLNVDAALGLKRPLRHFSWTRVRSKLYGECPPPRVCNEYLGGTVNTEY